MDRHRKLHVVGCLAVEASPKLRVPPGMIVERMTARFSSAFIEGQTEIATFKIRNYFPDPRVQANPDVHIEMSVDEAPGRCADNDTLVNRLRAIEVAVKVIIHRFEKIFGV